MANDTSKKQDGNDGNNQDQGTKKEFFVVRFFKWIGRGAKKAVGVVQEHPVIATAVTAVASSAATLGVKAAIDHFASSEDEGIIPMITGEEAIETEFDDTDTDTTEIDEE